MIVDVGKHSSTYARYYQYGGIGHVIDRRDTSMLRFVRTSMGDGEQTSVSLPRDSSLNAISIGGQCCRLGLSRPTLFQVHYLISIF